MLTGTNLVADGGLGGDYILDGAGNDTLSGGPGGDVWIADGGTDMFSGGDGDDTADYTGAARRSRSASTGRPCPARRRERHRRRRRRGRVRRRRQRRDRRERSRQPPDRQRRQRHDHRRHRARTASRAARATTSSTRATGASTRSTAARAPTRCSPTRATPPSTARSRPTATATARSNEQDCAPDNAAVHPGAGEIVGNAVDEDCKGGPQYLRVSASLSYSTARRGNTAKFTKLTVNEIKAGDTIEIRCTGGKRKACPFTKKTQTGKAGKAKVNLLSLLKKRYLKQQRRARGPRHAAERDRPRAAPEGRQARRDQERAAVPARGCDGAVEVRMISAA